MFQRDYLMRQIEQAARALAVIVKKALGGDPGEALAMFDQAYQPLLGVSSRVVSTLTDEHLVSLLTSGSAPDLRRVASVLEVVKTEADVHAQAGNQQAASSRYRRALSLAAHLASRSDELLDAQLAGDLVERTGGTALSAAQRLGLARVRRRSAAMPTPRTPCSRRSTTRPRIPAWSTPASPSTSACSPGRTPASSAAASHATRSTAGSPSCCAATSPPRTCRRRICPRTPPAGPAGTDPRYSSGAGSSGRSPRVRRRSRPAGRKSVASRSSSSRQATSTR